MYFLIEDNDLLKKCFGLFGIKLVLILKMNLIANLFTVISFEIKTLSYVIRLQILMIKKFLRQALAILV